MTSALEWKSFELFFEGSIYAEPCDEVLRKGVRPILKAARSGGWLQQYFFIRYAERGSHVRLRLRGRTPTLPQGVERELIRALECGTIVRYDDAATYHLELSRYGGSDGMKAAQRFFQASSETALWFIEAAAWHSRGKRLSSAALLMLITVHEFVPNSSDASRFLRSYGLQWRRSFADDQYRNIRGALAPQAELVWNALDAGRELPAPAAAYQAAAQRLKRALSSLFRRGRLNVPGKAQPTWEECVLFLLPSYVHMTNNRAGVAVPEERILAMALGEVLAGLRDDADSFLRAASTR